MAGNGKNPPNLLGVPKRKSGNDMGYQKTQKLVSEHEFAGQNPRVSRVKTDGRIGSVTPPQFLKGGLSVDNNQKLGPPYGPIGSTAASHMGPGEPKGNTWSPRVAKARAMKAAGMKAFSRPHVNPINTETPALKRGVKPD